MADPRRLARHARLDDHQIEAQREPRQRLAVRELASIEQAERRSADPCSLPMVDRFFGQAEFATDPPTDLDHDERCRRAWVDRHEVKLMTTDMDVPGQDGPADRPEMGLDELFGGVTRALRRGPTRIDWRIFHERSLTMRAYQTHIRARCLPACDDLRVGPKRGSCYTPSASKFEACLRH